MGGHLAMNGITVSKCNFMLIYEILTMGMNDGFMKIIQLMNEYYLFRILLKEENTFCALNVVQIFPLL